MQKRGVALVTVLFFMLVAIIAATALFKWLKYMGDSSAAELKRTEAYQASQAGVETVRAWLQYDANDVGAILGYYLNEKVPVRMDSVLAPLQSNKSQKFSVYLAKFFSVLAVLCSSDNVFRFRLDVYKEIRTKESFEFKW